MAAAATDESNQIGAFCHNTRPHACFGDDRGKFVSRAEVATNATRGDAEGCGVDGYCQLPFLRNDSYLHVSSSLTCVASAGVESVYHSLHHDAAFLKAAGGTQLGEEEAAKVYSIAS